MRDEEGSRRDAHQRCGILEALCAYIIDFVVVSGGSLALGLLTGFLLGIWIALGLMSRQTALGFLSDALRLMAFVGVWLYFALMESSARQATLGKRMLGLRVTDENGQMISLRRATGRYYAKAFSALSLGVGYLMIAFTGRKQALHDKMAHTYVVIEGR